MIRQTSTNKQEDKLCYAKRVKVPLMPHILLGQGTLQLKFVLVVVVAFIQEAMHVRRLLNNPQPLICRFELSTSFAMALPN